MPRFTCGNYWEKIAMACYCDPSSVPDYLDSNSAMHGLIVFLMPTDAGADDISNVYVSIFKNFILSTFETPKEIKNIL